MYSERNNLELELIRYQKHVYFIDVYFSEATDSTQYRPQKLSDQSWSDPA